MEYKFFDVQIALMEFYNKNYISRGIHFKILSPKRRNMGSRQALYEWVGSITTCGPPYKVDKEVFSRQFPRKSSGQLPISSPGNHESRNYELKRLKIKFESIRPTFSCAIWILETYDVLIFFRIVVN